MRKSIVTTLAALTALGMTAAPAQAEDISVEVTYADLDLTVPAGAKALEQRIEAAIGTVCEKPTLRDLKAMVAWEECKAAARASAHDQLSMLEPYAGLALAGSF